MRIVSCTCSNTEIVAALGCSDWLVGVDDYSDYPSEVVAGLPRVGPDLSVDPDRVAALEPDLVLASLTVPGHEKVVESLEKKGLEVMAPEPVSIEDVYRDVRDIALALGVEERGEKVAQELEQALRRRRSASQGEARPRLLVQWWPRPVIAPGRLSWVHDLLERAGGENLLGSEEVKSRPMEDEEVARLEPDAIVLSWCGVEPDKVRPDVVYKNPAWQDLAAVRKRRVFLVPEAFLGRPSPRLVEGYHALCDIVDQVSL